MLSEWLIRRAGGAEGAERTHLGVLEGWVSVVVNLAVCVVKLVPGVMLGSVSLVADAVHSLSDVLSSAVVIFGFRWAAKPPDREHPFGHGRAESIAAVLVAVLLLLTAWEFGRASVERLAAPRALEVPMWVLVVLAVTVLIKEWLARFAVTLGRRISSLALEGDAWHHRSDALTTVVVIGALAASRAGVTWVDGVAGLIVTGFIAWTGVDLLRKALDPLLGEAPTPELLREVRETACAVDGVDEVHDLIIHRYGELVVSSLHIEVPVTTTLLEAHDIAEEVEVRVNERVGGWSVVHVDPVDRDHPLYPEVLAFLEATVPALDGVEGFCDLRIVGGRRPVYVIFDVSIRPADQARAVQQLRAAVLERFPQVVKVHVNVRPEYVY